MSPDVINFGKMKLKGNFVLLHALKAYWGSVNIDPLVLNLGTKRMFWEVNFKTQTT